MRRKLTQPIEGEEKEDGASVEGTSNLANELVVPGDLGWSLPLLIAR